MGISTDTSISDTKIFNSVVRTVFLVTTIVSLAACSNAPTSSPWKQADDSPWSSKRSSDDNNVFANSAATETAASDPVLLAETKPEFVELESTPPAVIEPAAIAETAVVVVAVESQSAEQQVLAMDSASYAVQVYASTKEESMERFKVNKDMPGLMVVRTNRDGKIMYVLIDVHDDLAGAKQAAGYLEKKSGSKPWVRPMAGLQKIVDAE